MNDRAIVLFPDEAGDAIPPTLPNVPTADETAEPNIAQGDVGAVCRPADALSDEQLQAWIHHCGAEFVAAHRRYEASSCFHDAAERDNWWRREAEALIERGRRPMMTEGGNA